MFMSNYLRAAILNYVKGSTFPAATPVYLALFSDSVNPAGVGTEITATITGGNRPAILFGAISSNRIICNDPLLTITASAAGNGTIVSVGIYSTPTPSTGNLLFGGDLTAPIPVAAGTSLEIPLGDLCVILDEPCP
jgi:hypothetical protein